MKFSARQIAEFLHGELVGNPSVEVNNLSKIEEGTPGTLSFLANPKYTHYIYQTHASIVLVHKDFEPEHPIEATLIKVDDPYACLAMLLNLVNEATIAKRGIEQPNYVSSSVTLPERRGRSQYNNRPSYNGFYDYQKRCETRQPDTNRT